MTDNKKWIPEKLYKVIMDKVPICCVDVIFLNKEKDKTLLFKRNIAPAKNAYFSMGGGLAKGENFLDCAVRQAKRELNLKIDPRKTIFAGITLDNHNDSMFDRVSYHAVNIFFAYIIDSEKINVKLDKQHNDHKWFSVKDKTLHPFVKERLKQTLSKIKK